MMIFIIKMCDDTFTIKGINVERKPELPSLESVLKIKLNRSGRAYSKHVIFCFGD